jgi:hypothetical protein
LPPGSRNSVRLPVAISSSAALGIAAWCTSVQPAMVRRRSIRLRLPEFEHLILAAEELVKPDKRR